MLTKNSSLMIIKPKIVLISKCSNFSNKNIERPKSHFFKLKKKDRFWKSFKNSFLISKKVTFFTKLQLRLSNIKIIWHQFCSLYLPKKKKLLFKYTQKIGHNKFFFFLRKLELRLSILLLRSKFYFKLLNCYNAIKMNMITVNGIIITKINFILCLLDLFQKRRVKHMQHNQKKKVKRLKSLRWRKFRWKKARFFFWKIRRMSHFNLYLSKKQNHAINYLEINYKIPGCIVLKQPFLKELFLNQQSKIITNFLLKKIFFLY
jgi:hypothetical protein